MTTNNKKAVDAIMNMTEEEFDAVQQAFLSSLSLGELWSYVAYRADQDGNAEDTLTAAQKAVEHMPDNLHAAFSLGNAYYKLKMYEEAALHYERLALEPEFAKEVNELLFECYTRTNRYDDAQLAIERAVDYDPDNAVNRENLLNIMLHRKDFLGVLKYDVEELEKAPNDEETINRIWSSIIGLIRKDKNIYDIRDAVINAPPFVKDFVEILNEHERGNRKLSGRSAKEFVEAYADKLTPKIRPQILGMVVHYHFDNAAYEDARETISELLQEQRQITEEAHFLNLYGISLSRDGRPEEALDYYKQALEKDPENTVYYLNYIHVSKEIGNTDNVMEYGLKLARMSMRRAVEETNPQIKFSSPGSKDIALNLGVNDLDPRDPDKPLRPALGEVKEDLPILIESSIDLKLTPDGKVKIIETNDMYMSGFEGFKRAYGMEMREGLVIPHHKKLSEILASKYGHEIKVLYPVDAHEPLPYMVQAVMGQTQAVYTSATLGWKAVNTRKDYLHLTTPAEWEDIYPRTIVVPRSAKMTPKALEQRMQALLQDGQTLDDTNFIMKPCNDSIGRGVELVDGKEILAELHQATSWSSPAGSYWAEHIDPNIVVQECIRSKPVQADNGKFYDGTMRIAFTAMLSPDRKTVEDIQFFRPYWKLPANSIDDTSDARNSVVSFPPSSLKSEKYKDRADEIPVSARVGFNDQWEVEKQLRPYLEAILPQYAVPAEEFAAQMQSFARSQDDAKRGIALDLSTSFTHAAAIQIIGGQTASSKLRDAVDNARWGKNTGAARYRDYLFTQPVETADHAATLAERSQELIEKRLGLAANEVRLETKEWFSDPADIVPLVAKII